MTARQPEPERILRPAGQGWPERHGRPRAVQRLLVSLLCVQCLSGCAGSGLTPLTLPTSSVEPAPVADSGGVSPVGLSLALPSVAGAPKPVGVPTEIYTRVARGILTCWFGANGPLKPSYVYHAEASPPSKGGGALIDIHTRDKEVTDPRSIRAWRVAIGSGADGPSVDVQNFRLPEVYAVRLEEDVRRWAANEEGCGEAPVTGGWSAEPALQPAVQKSPSTNRR